MSPEFRRHSLYWFLILLVLAADQAVKGMILDHFPLGRSVEVIGDFFRLTYIQNTGAAFGILPGFASGLMIITIAAVVGILWYRMHTPSTQWWIQIPLSLILGGALGNLLDRVRFGWVVDFVDVGFSKWRWPAFNVADACISVGIVVLFGVILLSPSKTVKEKHESGADSPVVS